MTPNSSVFWHCVNFGLMRLNAFRWVCHSSIRRSPRTEHVRGLLQRRSILDSLCWRVLHCFSNQPVHIWLPRSVARKNNHRLAGNLREPSDWQAVEGKKPEARHAGDSSRTTGALGGTAGRTTDLLGQKAIGSPRWEDNYEDSSHHRPGGLTNHELAALGGQLESQMGGQLAPPTSWANKP